MKKDIQRGRSLARLADGATLFDPADDSHVSRVTPLQTKMKEFAASQADRLGTELAPDINKVREGRTTQLRRKKDVRPLSTCGPQKLHPAGFQRGVTLLHSDQLA